MGIRVSIEYDNKRKNICAHYETVPASSKNPVITLAYISVVESSHCLYGLVPVLDVVAKLVSCKTLLVILMPG
jgi:hypothetical protein